MDKNFVFIKKSELQTADISAFSSDLPDLKNISEAKSVVIGKWLINKIESGLNSGKIFVNNVMPSKTDFAYMLGVSSGTMQNAFRFVEDMGYIASKQCTGSLICGGNNGTSIMRKPVSKRDLAAEAIKNYLKNDKFSVGEILPSAGTISTIIGYSTNTTGLALDYLTTCGIIEHKYKNAGTCSRIVKSLDFETDLIAADTTKLKTMVDITAKDIEDYITANLKIGDKLPAHGVLAKSLKTSIKTVHDGLKILVDKGIILPRRGRYGSTVIKMPNTNEIKLKPEMSIFAPAKDAAFYHYEKIQNNVKNLIANKFNVGEKLPSITELSTMLDVSPNTVRKALHNLAAEGYLVFSRGRYGGTFVIDIPEVQSQTFKWLAVNPQYANLQSRQM